MKKRALISVSDKRKIVEFAQRLKANGYEIISTGGTLNALKDAGIEAISISDVTGFPECLDGRVKTLHPAVHAGLLAKRDNKEHMSRLKELNLDTIDIVAVNLYPFKSTIAKPDISIEDAIENIDIGGPSMLRSAAKNSSDVLVVVDPDDYDELIERVKTNTCDKKYRLSLMAKTFRHTAAYDAMIAEYFSNLAGEKFSDTLTMTFDKVMDLRYGENPHQSAAFYADYLKPAGCLALSEKLNGKELSFNNINDANGALDLLREFTEPCAVAVKHTNPCGVAIGKDIYSAYLKAYESDPVSIFGGIVALNREVDENTAKELVKIFLEIVIAPSFSAAALEILKTKPNLRVLKLAGLDKPIGKEFDVKRVYGGLLIQDKDLNLIDEANLKAVTKKQPTKEQWEQMLFGYKVVKHVKSNAIALVKDNAAIGLGIGQTNRILPTKQAIEQAGEKAKGAILASDAFFPFDDCVKEAVKAGITAIIQPGGSVRDADSIKACDEAGIAMVLTGLRHFKH